MKMMKKISIIFLSVLFVVLISCKEPNKKVDIKQLTQDAIHGDVEAQFTLAFYYEKGQHVEKNYDEAFKWYKKAAESGGAVTALLLAHCYEDGIGTEKDDKKVYELTMYAAEKNYSRAQYRVGVHLFYGIGVEKDEFKGCMWTYIAAKNGYQKAKADLESIKKIPYPPSIMKQAEKLADEWLKNNKIPKF